MANHVLIGVVGVSLLLPACSSRPRDFAPNLVAMPADRQAFDAAISTCKQLYVAGKLDRFGRSTSVGAGATAGATTAAVGVGTGMALGGYGGLAVASATIVLLPFAIAGGAWGMAKMKRAKKERAIRTAMTGCLAERGYDVSAWTRAPKRVAPTSATAR